jgi:uncharacterized protein involved in outer membrane biogenesis
LAVAYDDTWIKALIERRVAAVTGRHFEIGGDFDVSLGRPGLGLDASGVALGQCELVRRVPSWPVRAVCTWTSTHGRCCAAGST